MRHEVVRVTPEMATQWLAKPGDAQRKVDRNAVVKYARAMAEGRWFEPTIDPIALDGDGFLMNGQHRLLAVIRAEWSGDMLVAFDVDPAMFGVIDTGRRRLAQQFITVRSATAVASIVRLTLWYYRRWPLPPRGYNLSWDNDEILSAVTADADALEVAVRAADAVHRSCGVPVSVHGAVLYIARNQGADEGRVQEWVDGLATGAGLSVNDPRLQLRNRMLGAAHIRRDTVAMWQITARAFNAWVQGRDLARLIYDPSAQAPLVDLTGREVSNATKRRWDRRQGQAKRPNIKPVKIVPDALAAAGR